MPGAARKRSAKTGLTPGSLVHIGQSRAEQVKILLCQYDESRYIVLRLFHEDAGGGWIPEQVSIVLGPNRLISLQEKKIKEVEHGCF
jgi:hypothetical protein